MEHSWLWGVLARLKHGTAYGATYHVEFPHLQVMLHQKPQDVAVPEGGVELRFSQQEFALSHCLLRVYRVDSREEQKHSVTGLGESLWLVLRSPGKRL